MEIVGAVITADVAGATYDDRKHVFEHWGPQYLDAFSDGYTCGFVASDHQFTILAFRGTQNRLRPMESFAETTCQWLTNIDYAQKQIDGFRVHGGFWEQLNGVYNQVLRLVRQHAADRRPFVITGHSAGAALATAAAYRLSCDGVQPDAVYVYASPRVGDRAFGAALSERSIPVYRFEQKDDLVAHVPLSPSLSAAVGKVAMNKIFECLDRILPGCNFMEFQSQAVEYVHVGKLFYRDWDDNLLTSATWSEIADIFTADEQEETVFTVVPKGVLDVARLTSTAANVISQLDECMKRLDKRSNMLAELRFIADHNLPDLQSFLLRLAAQGK